METTQNFSGQLLLAMPSIGDIRFNKTVIYLHEHSSEGAIGFVINQIAEEITLTEIIDNLNVSNTEHNLDSPVFIGGPVDIDRGFVLHDNSYQSTSTVFSANGQIGVTSTLNILEALCSQHPLENATVILGYASWAPGQLEHEIQENAWLMCQFDFDLIFSIAAEKKYHAAMDLIGINPAMLSSDQGLA